jgi:hypothetical protein
MAPRAQIVIFFFFFALVAGSMLYRVIKNGGVKGALYGAPVRETVCEIQLQSRLMMKTTFKLDILEPADPVQGPHIGLEIIRSGSGSWELRPFSMTRDEARRLAEELTRAADHS